MTSRLGRRRREVDLAARLAALAGAADLLGERVATSTRADVQALTERAGRRAALGAERTVVALAGSTGSGKSSLFNAVAGLDLALTGVRRPTTSHTLACVWGEEGSGDLLDWLGIAPARRLAQESELGPDPGRLRGLVLLDLPDHDSMVAAHREEVDRLVGLVDVLVWVVDPQKYADAVLHEDYLRHLSAHGAVVVVVLNQVDRLTTDQQQQCLTDLQRLLHRDGLADVPVLPVSATRGDGVADLRSLLVRAVQSRRASADRLAADVSRLAWRLAVEAGVDDAVRAAPAEWGAVAGAEDALARRVADAVGVDALTTVVRHTEQRRAADAVGWPVARLLRRARSGPAEQQGGAVVALAVQDSMPVVQARVDLAVGEYVDEATAELPAAWGRRVRGRVQPAGAQSAEQASAGVVQVAAQQPSAPRWWPVWTVTQTLAALVAGVGLAWLVALVVLGIGAPVRPSAPTVAGLPWPGVLLVTGVAASVLLSVLVHRVPVRWGRRSADQAAEQMTARVREALETSVLVPVRAERQVHEAAVAALREVVA
jgi:GTP-binding protein EngB required for normal cell division